MTRRFLATTLLAACCGVLAACAVTCDARAPADGAPADGAPADGAPADGAPADGAPADGAPADGAPADGAPADGAPADGAPADGAPADGAPAAAGDTTPSPVRYISLDDRPGMSQAVVVEGASLVHTRQLLPLDRDGKLVGEGSADQQVEQVLANLEAVLTATGSDLGKLVKVNVYADTPQTAVLFRERLGKRPGAKARPAMAAVVTRLPHAGALIAVDAVALALASQKGSEVALARCETLSGDKDCADAAVTPRGGWVYLSGQPEKGPLGKATAKSLSTLLDTLGQLKIERCQVVQLKVFVQPAAAAGDVLREVRRLFPGQKVPPIVFVEWIASAPVEIELIAYRSLPGGKPAQTVQFYNPPGVKASPVFSRVALVQTDRVVYISGLASRTSGKGDAQVRDVFAQLKSILAQTGGDLSHLVKATYYVSDGGPNSASSALDELRPEFFDPQRPPAASKATVRGSGYADRTLSIDMIAVGRDP